MSSGGSVLPAHIDRKLLKKDNLPIPEEDLTLWYDAADISTITETLGNVVQWNDKSKNKNHVKKIVTIYIYYLREKKCVCSSIKPLCFIKHTNSFFFVISIQFLFFCCYCCVVFALVFYC